MMEYFVTLAKSFRFLAVTKTPASDFAADPAALFENPIKL